MERTIHVEFDKGKKVCHEKNNNVGMYASNAMYMMDLQRAFVVEQGDSSV